MKCRKCLPSVGTITFISFESLVLKNVTRFYIESCIHGTKEIEVTWQSVLLSFVLFVL